MVYTDDRGRPCAVLACAISSGRRMATHLPWFLGSNRCAANQPRQGTYGQFSIVPETRRSSHTDYSHQLVDAVGCRGFVDDESPIGITHSPHLVAPLGFSARHQFSGSRRGYAVPRYAFYTPALPARITVVACCARTQRKIQVTEATNAVATMPSNRPSIRVPISTAIGGASVEASLPAR